MKCFNVLHAQQQGESQNCFICEIERLNTTIKNLCKDNTRKDNIILWIFKNSILEGFAGDPKDVYEYVCQVAREKGREDNPLSQDEIEGFIRMCEVGMRGEIEHLRAQLEAEETEVTKQISQCADEWARKFHILRVATQEALKKLNNIGDMEVLPVEYVLEEALKEVGALEEKNDKD
jgi:hypothetical protein